MTGRHTPCVDCREPSRGIRCRACYIERTRSPQARAQASERSIALWRDLTYRRRVSEAMSRAHADPEFRSRQSETMKAAHARGDFGPRTRKKASVGIKAAFARGAYGKKWRRELAEATRRSHASGVYGKEWRQKQSEAHGGSDSSRIYPLDFDPSLKRTIRRRDNGRCVICGKSEGKNAHPVHHIDYDKQNNDPKNLIVLCKSCHSRTNTYREFWQPYFEGRVYLAMGVC